jgi:general secretion pathway protein E
VELIFAEAMTLQASHVILRPDGDALEVVYVIDGKEVPRDRVPSNLTAALVTRLKVLCNLDVTAAKSMERGRIDMNVGAVPKSCEVVFQELSEGVSILLDFVSTPFAEAPEVVQAWWLTEV